MLRASSYSSVVLLVYSQLSSALPMYDSLAHSLLTAIDRPRTPSIIFTLHLSTDFSYRPQSPLVVRSAPKSSAESSCRPQRSQIVRRPPQSSPELANPLLNFPYHLACRPYCPFSILHKQLPPQGNLATSIAGFIYKNRPG